MQFLKNFFAAFKQNVDQLDSEMKSKKAAEQARTQKLQDPDYKFYKWILSIPDVEWRQIQTLLVKYDIDQDEMLEALYSVHSVNIRYSDMYDGFVQKRQESRKMTPATLSSMLGSYVNGKAISNIAFPEKFAEQFADSFAKRMKKHGN